MNERKNERTNERMIERTNDRTNDLASERTNERRKERTKERTNERMNTWYWRIDAQEICVSTVDGLSYNDPIVTADQKVYKLIGGYSTYNPLNADVAVTIYRLNAVL